MSDFSMGDANKFLFDPDREVLTGQKTDSIKVQKGESIVYWDYLQACG